MTTLGAAAQHITTPMALAAAVLMLGVPLVQQVLKRRGRPNRDTKLVLRGIFILGLVFVVINVRAARVVWEVAEEERLAALALAGEDID